MWIIANGLGSLQMLAHAPEQQCVQLPNSEVYTGATQAPQGNRRSQRTCVPAPAFPNRSLFCTLFSVVLKLCLAHFRFWLERKQNLAF